MNNTITTFDDIIGQTEIKNKLSFYLRGFRVTKMIPHFMFVSEKGTGKTFFSAKVAKELVIDGKPKTAKLINCATIKNLKQFVEQVLIPFIQDNTCTLLLDEASELPKDLTMSLLTMLNPNNENRNTFVYQDMVFDIDFTKHSFLLATSEPDKIFHALMSRCNRLDLEAYKPEELMEIVRRNIIKNNVKLTFTDDVVELIPTVLRRNPRCAQMMANDVINYCSQFNIDTFDIKAWNDMKKQLGIKPLGLNSMEIKVLQALNKNPHSRLLDLAAKTGMSATAVQKDAELHLLRNNLMKVDNGRCLTMEGQKYLEGLV